MDKLLGSFTKSYINTLDEEGLKHLSNLLEYDDENLFKFNQGEEISIKINVNKVTNLFKNFIYMKD